MAQSPEKDLILVVDDQPSNVLVLRDMLVVDYEVSVAADGEAAIELCRTQLPALVLLDVGMPGMDGFEVCRRLKLDPATVDIPIVFVTAANSPQDEAQAFACGAADFISKPFHHVVVKARVKTQLALKRQADVLRSYAATDGLTGLANRRRFDEALATEWRRAERESTPLSLLLLDVDRFKAYNDRYGHQAGDVCLQAISSAVRTFARRPGDLAARYGGEEIVLLLPGADETFAAKSAQSVRLAIEALALPHTGNPEGGSVVTTSVGVATHRPQLRLGSPERLVQDADEALYEAKRSGRNRVCCRRTVEPALIGRELR